MNITSLKIKTSLLSASVLTASTLSLVPGVAFAQPQTNQCAANFSTIGDFFTYGTCLLSRTIVPLIVTVALVMFLFGVMKFILNSGDETKRREGREFMLWGIISLFVMLSIWGILNLLTNTFGLTVFAIPQFQ